MFKKTSLIGALRPQREDFLTSASNVFDEIFNQHFQTASPVQTELGYPKFNAYKQPVGRNLHDLVLDIFMPYVTDDDVEINASDGDNSLTILVKNHQDKNIKEADYFVRQISRGSFRRTFVFDSEYLVKNAKADLKDGMLKISIPFSGVENQVHHTHKIKIGK